MDQRQMLKEYLVEAYGTDIGMVQLVLDQYDTTGQVFVWRAEPSQELTFTTTNYPPTPNQWQHVAAFTKGP